MAQRCLRREVSPSPDPLRVFEVLNFYGIQFDHPTPAGRPTNCKQDVGSLGYETSYTRTTADQGPSPELVLALALYHTLPSEKLTVEWVMVVTAPVVKPSLLTSVKLLAS